MTTLIDKEQRCYFLDVVMMKSKTMMELKLNQEKLYTLDNRVVDAVMVGRPQVITVKGPIEGKDEEAIPIGKGEWTMLGWSGRLKILPDKIEERVEHEIHQSCPEGANAYLAGKLQDFRSANFYGNWGKAVQYYRILEHT